jgi:ankyrin repeat protein
VHVASVLQDVINSDLFILLPSSLVFTDRSHLLLEAGADPNCVDPLERAPLHAISSLACSASSAIISSVAINIGRDFISHGAAICSSTKELLPTAAHRGKLDVVEYLIKDVGSDPNVVWRQGMTSLILAARTGRMEIVNLLLTFDTLDLDIVDNSGKTAVDYAIANGHNDIVTMLAGRKLQVGSHSEN